MNKCNVYLWPSEEGVDPRCGYPRPCGSHEPKAHNLKHRPQLVMQITPCPECASQTDGPGGIWLLNGELAYGATGRWPCDSCGYVIKGEFLKQ